jgi:hypothetical protein
MTNGEVFQQPARWDAQRKSWYVPDGIDLVPFNAWIPPEPHIRSDRYSVVETSQACWSCKKSTKVFGFLLPETFETLELIEDAEDESKDELQWEVAGYAAFVSFVTELLPSVADRLKILAPRYRLDFSQTTQSTSYMNHCEHCGAKQGDHFMHDEPGGVFFSVDRIAAPTCVVHDFSEPFSCNGGQGYSASFETSNGGDGGGLKISTIRAGEFGAYWNHLVTGR